MTKQTAQDWLNNKLAKFSEKTHGWTYVKYIKEDDRIKIDADFSIENTKELLQIQETYKEMIEKEMTE